VKKYSILIVDDEKMVLKVVENVLLKDNYEIITAQSGREGLEKLEQHRVDMVISDQKMPEMDGVDFLARVKLIYPETVTVLLTAYAEIETAIKAINEAGINKFIQKPFSVDDFRIAIRSIFESLQAKKERDRLQQKDKGAP
jgi:DNA-binding NtrC family response regulator